VPPLLNANAVIQCPHGGRFAVVPRGPRPVVGGAPALNVQDFPGVVAAGCSFTVAGAPAPCAIVSVVAGTCPTIILSGSVAVNQALVCATSNGVPSIPIASTGQITVHST
jgi:hypothetical protein